jgi:hypothetical protein
MKSERNCILFYFLLKMYKDRKVFLQTLIYDIATFHISVLILTDKSHVGVLR